MENHTLGKEARKNTCVINIDSFTNVSSKSYFYKFACLQNYQKSTNPQMPTPTSVQCCILFGYQPKQMTGFNKSPPSIQNLIRTDGAFNKMLTQGPSSMQVLPGKTHILTVKLGYWMLNFERCQISFLKPILQDILLLRFGDFNFLSSIYRKFEVK